MQIELEESVDELKRDVRAAKAGDVTDQEGLFLNLRSAVLRLTCATFAGIVDSSNIGDYLDMVNQERLLITDPHFNERATTQVRRFLRTCFEKKPQLYSAIPAPLKRGYVSFL